jgi:endonuclease/exonuclease/phosphatase family metal-dependent hydrolase
MHPLSLLALLAFPAQAETFFNSTWLERLSAPRAEVRAAAARRKERRAAPAETTLRVLTYNIWGIPLGDEDELFIGRHDRYGEIGRILARQRKEGTAPQIVAIQEAFHPRTPELVKEAGYPYAKAGNQTRRGKLLGSGLWILSEYPIEEVKTVDYADCTGTDCWANKGAIAARIRVPGLPTPVVFVDTHLNADTDSGSPTPDETRKIRISQLAQFAALVDEIARPGEPVILAADFNFRPGDEDYRLVSSRPGFSDGVARCLKGNCDAQAGLEGEWRGSVDHHFFSSGALDVAPVLARQVFTRPVDGTPLSDHVGLEVHYKLIAK